MSVERAAFGLLNQAADLCALPYQMSSAVGPL